LALKPPRENATTAAEAGAQLGDAPLADAALPYFILPKRAPAFAGVVFMDGQAT